MINRLVEMGIDINNKEYDLFKYNSHDEMLMYVALVIILSAILTVAIGYTVDQLAYGQLNMTGENMTSSNMTMGTDTQGSVSGGLAVSDEGASGKKK
jgi:hypothetical protein